MKTERKINTDTWVEKHGDALFRYAVLRLKDPALAEDVVQETFLAALQSKDRFKGKSSEKTWLFAILKHKIIDHYRKNRPNRYGKEILQEEERLDLFFKSNGRWQELPQRWHSDPGKAQEIREFFDHFYRCLAQVPERNANAFVYREIDGLNTRQICELLDVTETNCWVMLYRARMLLRKCLEMAGIYPTKAGVRS
jgi:RNA polymerase sigma-70 factor (ECF subfamily)